MNLRIISKEDIHRVVSMAQAIDLVKEAFAQLSQGLADVPLRAQLGVARNEGTVLFMPAYLHGTDSLGLKIVSVFPQNQDKGIPTIHALVTVVDAETGLPLAVMDGTHLTALRTGAASGAATDLLARDDARVAAVFGTGVQGRTQLEAVCEVREIEKAWIYDLKPEACERYAEEMSARGGRIPAEIAIASSASEAVREADIICTATTSPTPVFEDDDVTPGTHINAAGAYTPETREIPEGTIQRARLFVDSREACWDEAGDLIIPRSKGLIAEDDIQAELGELVSGVKPGRSNDQEITFFKSVGNAVQDVAVAGMVLEAAVSEGLGTIVDI